MAYNNFRVDPNQYLNQTHSLYRNSLYSVALSNPTKYFKYQKEVNDYVRTQAIQNLYNTIYDALNTGTKVGGAVLISNALPQGTPTAPKVSEKLINEISLSAASTLNSILDEVLEMICPIDYNTLANNRLKISGESNKIVFNPTNNI